MKKYICSICDYVYDEAMGIPDQSIKAGTKWDDIPSGWECPLCGAPKDDFAESVNEEPNVQELELKEESSDEINELTSLEISALCSNLSKGCEKQFKSNEAELFTQLSDYFNKKSDENTLRDLEDINSLIENDLPASFSNVKEAATNDGDRGALRALAWGEKVTKLIQSLIQRYLKDPKKVVENKNVYVCEICGFIYVGDKLPDLCPICKVPNFKLEQIIRR